MAQYVVFLREESKYQVRTPPQPWGAVMLFNPASPPVIPVGSQFKFIPWVKNTTDDTDFNFIISASVIGPQGEQIPISYDVDPDLPWALPAGLSSPANPFSFTCGTAGSYKATIQVKAIPAIASWDPEAAVVQDTWEVEVCRAQVPILPPLPPETLRMISQIVSAMILLVVVIVLFGLIGGETKSE